MTESSSLLNGKTLCVITGASRGYGKCLAEIFVSRLTAGSCCLILARNSDQLKDIADRLNTLNNGVKVAWDKLDQSDLRDCSIENVRNILSKAAISLQDFETVILLHNAGTTGDLTKYAWEMSDSIMVEDTMNVNITGTILLNSALLNEIRSSDMKCIVVINISSLAAIKSFPSWSLYCAGKAARNMFFETLAKEEPSIRVLNWAPGPLDTEMQVHTRKCADPKVREAFIDMHKTGKLLKCEDSVNKLITVLEGNTFQSGQHIDYYDV